MEIHKPDVIVESIISGESSTALSAIRDLCNEIARDEVTRIQENTTPFGILEAKGDDDSDSDVIEYDDDDEEDDDDEDGELDEAAAKRKILFRKGKRVVKKKCPKGFKIVNGTRCKRITGAEKITKSRAAKKAARKRKSKTAQSNRRRAQTNRRRRSAGL